MSLMPWGNFGGMSPFDDSNSMFPMDPFMSRGGYNVMPRTMMPSIRRMEREVGKLISSVKEDDKSFQVMVDVSHFHPSEITVKTTDKHIIVHARHEERNDQHGFVSREFRRRVTIPEGVNHESVTSTISPEGILTILAPKMMLEGSNERVIPITMAPAAGSHHTSHASLHSAHQTGSSK
ncbi:heat shock protein beta-6-like [Daphnia pulicaria]|uniref:heat shock protein beta-6-like n=1 Tax=Daphnia pulicaria TaxID=35523 RepID=UPI001EEB4235|nr:heat shock protein beta-6-like [Daphnia pulicaria]XP_046651985.1 heat shock protein beta-6-like [Daphnia pulicaria]XP_046651992.1 heat shock protein beta-6-like [Daphnia pulicaria]